MDRKKFPNYLIIIGILAALISGTADFTGLGTYTGIGPYQLAGMIAGAFLCVVGVILSIWQKRVTE